MAELSTGAEKYIERIIKHQLADNHCSLVSFWECGPCPQLAKKSDKNKACFLCVTRKDTP